MDYGKAAARIFAMDEATWARHASPWSVWTRVSTLPVLVLAFWSRTWLGWWCLVPIALVLVWVWLNPRLFPPPRTTESWASKATFGERVWLNRARVPIPDHHRIAAHVLSALSAVGVALVIWGLVDLAIWPTVSGTAIAYIGKLWFCDRMVWLYEDMKDSHAEYREWLR